MAYRRMPRAFPCHTFRIAIGHVDLAATYELDLNQARTCKEKKELVEELAALNDGKAKQVLIRARDIEVKEGGQKTLQA